VVGVYVTIVSYYIGLGQAEQLTVQVGGLDVQGISSLSDRVPASVARWLDCLSPDPGPLPNLRVV
jgi:hypothetical protein